MNRLSKLLKLIFKLVFHPSHLSVVMRDTFNSLSKPESDQKHLNEAIEWLKRSHDATDLKGSSGIYTFLKGWTEPYPETTGYIIPTLLKYSDIKNDQSLVDRAIKMADWEIDIQLDSGAVRGGVGINEYPIVFNTGQVMIGWVAIYKHTNDKKYLEAAKRAANWLVGNMDEDGKWSKNTYNNHPHAYNVRVTWPLYEVGRITNNQEIINAAEKNIRWVLSGVQENGWINHMDFEGENEPFTHTIAYTLRGLLECSFLADKDFKKEIQSHVVKAAKKIEDIYKALSGTPNTTRNFLPGTIGDSWNSTAKYSCLTGNAQMAIIWIKLYHITNEKSFLDSATKNLEQLKSTQRLSSSNGGIKGAIAGSYPTWGGYIHYAYPNWATKFFADAMMLKAETVDKNT
jgi:uncharacterized protein YyaL (SSP411 family)